MVCAAASICSGLLLLQLCTAVQSLGDIHQQRELYVKSDPTQPCPEDYQCHTLLVYLQNATTTFITNTTLYFLPGSHSAVLSQARTLVISHVTNLVFIGPEEHPPVVEIQCNYTMQFHFREVLSLSIRNIKYFRCGTTESDQSEPLFPLQPSVPPAALQFNTVHSLVVENVHITHSNGYGLFALNVIDNSSIKNSKLSYNHWKSDSRIGGNALFIFKDIAPSSDINVILSISSSVFSYGTFINRKMYSLFCMLAFDSTHMHDSKDRLECGSGGLGIMIHSISGDSEDTASLHSLDISLSNCTFHNNDAYAGGNMIVKILQNTNLPLMVCTLLISNSTFSSGKARQEGGGLVLFGRFKNVRLNVIISDTTFRGNSAFRNGGGFYCACASLYSLHIVETNFVENTAVTGGGASLENPPDTATVIFENTSFVNNVASQSGGGLYFIQQCTDLELRGCHFTSNEANDGGGIELVLQAVLSESLPGAAVIKTTIFKSNNAIHSGGHLYVQAKVHTFDIQTLLIAGCTFKYGSAFTGGAVSINTTLTVVMKIVQLQFSNNNCRWMGGAIYMYCQTRSVLISISRSVFNKNIGDYGGAVGIGSAGAQLRLAEWHNLQFYQCILSENKAKYGAGIFIIQEYLLDMTVTIYLTQFVNNMAERASAIDVTCDKFLQSRQVSVHIKASHFKKMSAQMLIHISCTMHLLFMCKA